MFIPWISVMYFIVNTLYSFLPHRTPRPRGGRARHEGAGEALQQRQHDRAQVRDREGALPPRRRRLAEGRHAALLQHLQRRHQVSLSSRRPRLAEGLQSTVFQHLQGGNG